ncbi:MAG: serine/threonine-protein kinase, partial [Myxococcota bacterium]|nr:serine/threonine-protein kinase [Myxococcota bacterium]
FAQVFVARHRTFGDDCAVKVLHPQYVTNEKVRERFKREARLQHKHSHPNIVRILDIIDEPGLAAIVMEHIVGVDLDTHLEGDWAGRFSPEDAMLLMDPLLDAVKFIHERGIVHRDLKPSNILLDEAHGTWPPVPKLTDFGIAKLLEAEVGHTKTGARMGSWVYGAPEQFRSAGKVSPAADVFSLGMMLRRMLTGELPVDPDDEAAVWGFYLGHIALRPLREEAPELPAGLVEILDQAVAIDPAARPADADAFATLLDRALASAGVRRDGAGADAPEISPAPPAQEKTPASEAQEVPGSEAQEAPASEEQEAPGSEAQEAPSPEPEAPSPEETPPPAEEAPAAPLELVTPSPVETSTSDDGEVSLEVPQASAMGWFMAAAAVTFMGLGLWFSGGDPAPASPRTDARPSAPRAEEPGAVAPARQAKAEAKVEPAVPEPPPPPELPPGFVYVPAGTY